MGQIPPWNAFSPRRICTSILNYVNPETQTSQYFTFLKKESVSFKREGSKPTTSRPQSEEREFNHWATIHSHTLYSSQPLTSGVGPVWLWWRRFRRSDVGRESWGGRVARSSLNTRCIGKPENKRTQFDQCRFYLNINRSKKTYNNHSSTTKLFDFVKG